MSRCFPFPPPGYEKRTRTDDVDLLNKDKHKEKKHKKEKRDRKREGKDKKDKERSKDKDREKNERKEKDKDKKKSKDKRKTDEEKIEGQNDGSNGGKHCENNNQGEAIKSAKLVEIGSSTDEERGRRDQMVENLPTTSDSRKEHDRNASDSRKEHVTSKLEEKYYVNMAQEKENNKNIVGHDQKIDRQRIKDEGRVTGYSVGPSFTGTEQRRGGGTRESMEKDVERKVGNAVGPSFIAAEHRRVGGTAEPMERDVERKNGNPVDPSFIAAEQRRFGGTSERMERDVERKNGNPVGPSFIAVEQKRVGGTAEPMERDVDRKIRNPVGPSFTAGEQRSVGRTAEPMERDVDRKIGNPVGPSFTAGEQRSVGRTAEPMERDVERKIGNTGPSFTAAEQRRVGSTAETVEKDVERKTEGKEKNKEQKGNDKQDDKRKHKHKHKHRDGEKKSKEKKTTEKTKMKEKVKHENRKDDKMIEVPKDHINTLNIKSIQNAKDSEKSGGIAEENLRKRKDCETNGYLHDNDVLPNKLPKPNLFSPPLTANGRKSELGQLATQFASALHRGANNVRFDNKVLKVNGLIQAQPTSTSSTSRQIAPGQTPPVQPKENGETSKRPPHPDSKYLSQILSVPKMDDWSDFDDQEWLFGSDSLQAKKPKTVSSGVDGSPQVWDRALRIDSADICALPYVIPY